MDRSGAGPEPPGVPISDHLHHHLPVLYDVVSNEDTIESFEDEGTDADDVSEIISVGGSLSTFVRCASEGVTVEEVIEGIGLISDTYTALDATGQPLG